MTANAGANGNFGRETITASGRVVDDEQLHGETPTIAICSEQTLKMPKGKPACPGQVRGSHPCAENAHG
jgi:hypothetical protein